MDLEDLLSVFSGSIQPLIARLIQAHSALAASAPREAQVSDPPI